MGRHYGINVIVSIQKYRLASTVMRTQSTLLIYFKARSMVDLEAFLEENSALVPGGKKQLMEIYKLATAEPFGFLTINMLTKDPSKIFMKNLEAYLVPSWVNSIGKVCKGKHKLQTNMIFIFSLCSL